MSSKILLYLFLQRNYERIDVVSESEWITEGTAVKVISAEGYRHVVRAVASVAEESAE